MLGRASRTLWRAAQLARHPANCVVPVSLLDCTNFACIAEPAQQLISLRSFSAAASPHPSLIRDFAIIGAKLLENAQKRLIDVIEVQLQRQKLL